MGRLPVSVAPLSTKVPILTVTPTVVHATSTVVIEGAHMKKIIQGSLFAVLVFPALASGQSIDESWTPGMKTQFRQGCAVELERAGFTTAKSWSACDCMAAYVEEEFGLAEFGYITALDERDMPEIERRFDEAIAPCFE